MYTGRRHAGLSCFSIQDPIDEEQRSLLVMQKLSRYISGAASRKVPAKVAERARLHLVDTFAAMISGSRLLPGRKAIEYVKPWAAARKPA